MALVENWFVQNTYTIPLTIDDIITPVTIGVGITEDLLLFGSNTPENISASAILRNLVTAGRMTSDYLHTHDEFSFTSHTHSGLDILTGGLLSDADGLHTHGSLTSVSEVNTLIGSAISDFDDSAYVVKAGSINQLSDIISTGAVIEDTVSKAHDEVHTILEHADDDSPFLMSNYIKLVDGSNADCCHVHSFQTIQIHNDLTGLDGGTTDEYYHLTLFQHDTLTDGSNADSLHIHGHNNLQNIQGGTTDEYYHLTEEENSLVGRLGEDSSGLTFNGLPIGIDSLWIRSGDTLSPLNSGDNISTTGDISSSTITTNLLTVSTIQGNNPSELLTINDNLQINGSLGIDEGIINYDTSADAFTFDGDVFAQQTGDCCVLVDRTDGQAMLLRSGENATQLHYPDGKTFTIYQTPIASIRSCSVVGNDAVFQCTDGGDITIQNDLTVDGQYLEGVDSHGAVLVNTGHNIDGRLELYGWIEGPGDNGRRGGIIEWWFGNLDVLQGYMFVNNTSQLIFSDVEQNSGTGIGGGHAYIGLDTGDIHSTGTITIDADVKIPGTMLWAEETSNLSTGTSGGLQFSFGNGATAGQGPRQVSPGKVVAMSMQHTVSADFTGVVQIAINGVANANLACATTGVAHGGSTDTHSGVAFSAGDRVSFITTTTPTGATNGVVMACWIVYD